MRKLAKIKAEFRHFYFRSQRGGVFLMFTNVDSYTLFTHDGVGITVRVCVGPSVPQRNGVGVGSG